MSRRRIELVRHRDPNVKFTISMRVPCQHDDLRLQSDIARLAGSTVRDMTHV